MENSVKKKFTFYISVVLVLLGTFSLFWRFFSTIFDKSIFVREDLSEKNYYSTLLFHDNLTSNWKPGDVSGTSNGPEISGQSSILVDANSGKVVYEKNSTIKMKIASLAKMMTAVVALEHKKVGDEIIVSPKAAMIGENVMGISTSEVYTLEELLYGLVLNSGNDAAYAIAEGVAGDSGTFVKWMNMKAKELGLSDTYFADPSGLSDDSYSTAVDLVKLARYAMQNEEFKKIAGTINIELPYSDKHKYLYLENQTNLLSTYPGVAGIKTGYTEEAGYCLVTYAKNENIELIGAVLKSENRKFDMIWMLDYGFSVLGLSIDHPLLIF
jgi:D-alanyl-D-alanine carboxypeptidase (penicillin-binding protein 5/6)